MAFPIVLIASRFVGTPFFPFSAGMKQCLQADP